VHADTGPLPVPANVCTNSQLSTNAGGYRLQTDCAGAQLDEHWRHIDDRTWERVIHGSYSSLAMSTGSPAQALAMAGLSAADRAKIEASLPTQADRDAAMAPVIAQLEEAAKSDKPEEAAEARQQLEALRGQTHALDTKIELRERWTRIADSCASKR